MRLLILSLVSTFLIAAGGGVSSAEEPDRDGNRRTVLVELYTSQGCDMCPEAERQLGVLAGRNPRVVPVAFHVDYFDEPWKDPFSDALHSQRQAVYNALYTKPKNPQYGLYYTPMLMVDGEQSVNGRDADAAQAAVRQALARKPLVTLDAALELKSDGLSGDLTVKAASRSPRASGRDVLVCAVLRDDKVVTEVRAGENADKTLTSRFPARTSRFEYARLDAKAETTLRFPFRVEPDWKADRLGLVVFVQDRKTGAVYQSAFVPWKPTATASPDRPRR
jgi:hypothetical protein